MKKIVLAYSGGLDTSIILKWLQTNYKAEIIAYTSDIGQDIDRKKIIKNAKRLGVKKIIIEDLKNTFVKDYIFYSTIALNIMFSMQQKHYKALRNIHKPILNNF